MWSAIEWNMIVWCKAAQRVERHAILSLCMGMAILLRFSIRILRTASRILEVGPLKYVIGATMAFVGIGGIWQTF